LIITTGCRTVRAVDPRSQWGARFKAYQLRRMARPISAIAIRMGRSIAMRVPFQ